MKPQASIEPIANNDMFKVIVESDSGIQTIDQSFDDYATALDFVLQQGWQLKREIPADSLHIDIRFRKP